MADNNDQKTSADIQHDLDMALQAFVADRQHGGLLTSWALIAEHNNGDGAQNVCVYVSQNMTPWKLAGFADWGHYLLRSIVSKLFNNTARAVNGDE